MSQVAKKKVQKIPLMLNIDATIFLHFLKAEVFFFLGFCCFYSQKVSLAIDKS